MSVFSGKKADVSHSSVVLSLILLAVRTNLLADKYKDPVAARTGLAPLGTSAQRAGLEHVKLHGLRHFVATELLTAGIGHGSPHKTKRPLNTSTPCSTRPQRLAESEPRLGRSARMVSC